MILRRQPLVAAFLAAGTLALSVVGVVRGQRFVWVYLPVLIGCVAIVVLLDRARGPIPGVLVWMLAIWAVLHLAGGLAPNPTGRTQILYGMWIVDGSFRFDHLVHGYGIGVATAVLVVAMRDTARPLLSGFLAAQAVGLANEIVENAFAHFVEGSNVGDAVNTAWDLAWHVIGGVVALAVMAWRGVPQVAETTS